MTIKWYSKITGREINPYSDCPECNCLYKDCEHLGSNSLEVAINNGMKVTSINKGSVIFYNMDKEDIKQLSKELKRDDLI